MESRCDEFDRAEIPRIPHSQRRFHSPVMAKDARRHDVRLVLTRKLQDLPGPGHGAADGFVAEGRQSAGQPGSHQIKMVFTQTGGITHPDRIDFLDHLFQRCRHPHARKDFGKGGRGARVGVVVMRDARVGEGEFTERDPGIAIVFDVTVEACGIVLLVGVEIEIRMEILGEQPGMTIARLRLAADRSGHHTNPKRLARCRLVGPGRTGRGQRNQAGGANRFQEITSRGRRGIEHANSSG